MFSDFDKTGEIWVGTGPRERHKRVTSKEKFVCPPSVTLNISLWDVHNETNFRMKLQAIDITESGFTASFETWDDTQIARMHVTWQESGDAIDPDEIWDVLGL